MRQVLRLAPAVLVAALLLAGCGQASAPVAPKATAAPAAVSLHLSAGPPAAEIGGSEYAVVLTVKGLVKGGTYGLNGGTSPWQLLANACVKDGLVVGGSTSCTIVVQGVTGTTKFTLQERSNVSNTVVVTW
ncbi:MAG: hypothetical protein M0027_12700 [Candidatus Dormibacteraeota bacterium]|nr:hypothetical protein [Candidatus Dormibacteraeota bacterium]